MRSVIKAVMLWGSLLCVNAVLLSAQDKDLSWSGEWGSFVSAQSAHGVRYQGAGVSISGCEQQRCNFAIQVENGNDHGAAKGYLEVQSPTSAVAHLVALEEEHCTLRLTQLPSASAIEVRVGQGDCRYFLTSGANFTGSYGLHSRDGYVSDDLPSCFAATSPAKLALCRSEKLVESQRQWLHQYWRVAEVSEPSGGEELLQEHAAEEKIQSGCEEKSQEMLETCLATAYSRSREELESRMAAWRTSVLEPGDSEEAAAKAKAIAGRYRRHFANGDIAGDHFTSTDKMTITALGKNAIHFDLELEFYNGHECSLEGKANYSRAGFFVFQQKSESEEDPECIFEIIPGKDGVKLNDPTGGCKLMSCGARGGYNGAEFLFHQRY